MSSSNGKKAAYDSESDDDLVEVTDTRLSNVKSENTERSSSAIFATQTPPHSSREASAAGSNATRNGNKRSAEVIDLTLSDDDEPPRPAKRPALSQANGQSVQSHNHQSRISLPSHPSPRPPIGGIQPFRIQNQPGPPPTSQRQNSNNYQRAMYQYWDARQQ